MPPVAVPPPETYDVAGGTLTARRFGSGPRVALAVHGITAAAMAWSAVARALTDDWSLVAVDLRGRGHSRDLPGPFGLRTHAADVHRVAERLVAGTGGPIVLVGHSMGAYVAVHAAAERPDLFARVVLVDGGVALPLPVDADPDEVLAATLGPALERLRVEYPSVDAYVEVFRAHPALAPAWDDATEAYARYDALPVAGGVRSRAVEEAVRADGRDLLVGGADFEPEVRGLERPVQVLAAPSGMFGQPGGLLPAAGLAAYDALPHVAVRTVPDVNHYTILLAPPGARAVAEAISG